MSWRELLEDGDREVVTVWLGGRSVRVGPRAWQLDGRRPPQPGWYRFRVTGRRAALAGPAAPEPERLVDVRRGFLVGDRFASDDVRVAPDPVDIARQLERVALVPPTVERFARISVGRVAEGAPLVFCEEELPLGPEPDVASAFLDGAPSVDHVPEVPPALDAAFRLETERRRQAERRREQARRQAELDAARAAVLERHGDGAQRRALAQADFQAAARAALEVGEATYLDHRPGVDPEEMVVRFRLDGQRFECTCERRTLRIVDAGICLTDDETDERGDDYFTLESLPGVIRQAIEENALVVFRHLD